MLISIVCHFPKCYIPGRSDKSIYLVWSHSIDSGLFVTIEEERTLPTFRHLSGKTWVAEEVAQDKQQGKNADYTLLPHVVHSVQQHSHVVPRA